MTYGRLPCASALALAIGLAIAAALPGAAADRDRYVPSTPEPGTEIPASTIRLGLKPYADNSFYVIAMKKGWFDDVGITLSPPEGISLTEDNTNAMIINNNVDISAQFPPMSLPTYRTSDAIKQIMFTDVILSGSILAHPSLGFKTFRDFTAEGMPFAEAMHATIEQTRGQTLYAPSPVVERVLEDSVAKLADSSFDLDIMEDAQILVAARADQIKLAHPGGAPIVYSLLQNGWVQLVSLADLLEHAPRSPDSPLLPTIQIVGNVANADFINTNQTTVLRFMSAVWRTVDEIAKDEGLLDLQAPYLNSVAGTSLTGDDLRATFRNFHPLTTFDDSAKYYTDDSLLNYKPIYDALIREYETNRILPEGVEADDFIWGGALWRDMMGYREKADALFTKLEGAELPQDKQDLLEKARQFYAWHDYLDAYRLASAVSQS
jgi:ABC-type nitrate/sulfonate/bicarbonate transport system substrate-binding protein